MQGTLYARLNPFLVLYENAPGLIGNTPGGNRKQCHFSLVM